MFTVITRGRFIFPHFHCFPVWIGLCTQHYSRIRIVVRRKCHYHDYHIATQQPTQPHVFLCKTRRRRLARQLTRLGQRTIARSHDDDDEFGLLQTAKKKKKNPFQQLYINDTCLSELDTLYSVAAGRPRWYFDFRSESDRHQTTTDEEEDTVVSSVRSSISLDSLSISIVYHHHQRKQNRVFSSSSAWPLVQR